MFRVSDSNLKKLVRLGLPFFHAASLFRWRATLPPSKGRTFYIFDDEAVSYREAYRASLRYAWWFDTLAREMHPRGADRRRQLRIGIYAENRPEYLFAFFGAALSGNVLFALNTGFRGSTLARIVNDAELDCLLLTADQWEGFASAVPDLGALGERSIYFLGERHEAAPANAQPLASVLDELERAEGPPGRPPRVDIDQADPLIIVYTSGTTALPKGVVCSQLKLAGAGALTASRIDLGARDRGYVAMPLFHSNAWFLGIMPLLLMGGSFVLKRRFSASAFEEDLLRHRFTYMNYVGQPIHYILAALEQRHGSGDRVEAALARHPDNCFRIAHGNGATVVDREKLVRYLGMEHVFELYGSTEGTINTMVRPGDPPDSVGEARGVVILDERDRPCPPGRVDAHGRLLNYEEAVGEIARPMQRDNLFFDGYHDNPEATSSKFRNGHYCSGDLGHIRIVRGRRFLYFNGRKDDWIRKDGENFSAESVTQIVSRLPGVALAAAYGVPAEIADEKVMAAIQLQPGVELDPKLAFDWLTEQHVHGEMDPKWMPDYLRIVEAFPMSPTQKILVRDLKRQHFDLRRHPEMVIFHRERDDTTYRLFGPEDFAERLARFVSAGRGHVLSD